MAEIKVKKVTSQDGGMSKRELYATVCYFYPQYTLKEAATLSGRDLQLLLNVAQRQEAIKWLNLTQIAAAPHTKNGSGVKTLTERYKGAAK